MNHNYRYVKFYTPSGVGYGVVSFEWEKLGGKEEEKTWLRYAAGVSLCNPRDRFNKALGRRIADGRLQKQLRVDDVNIDCSNNTFVTNAEFNQLLPEILSSMKNAPRWATRAAKKGSFDLGLREAQSEVISLDAAYDLVVCGSKNVEEREKSICVT